MPDDKNKKQKDGNNSDDEDDVPPPGEGLSEEIFEVERIIEHVIDDDKVLFFKVRWKNYGPDDDSWEPADNLGAAGVAIEAYWTAQNAAKKAKTEKANTKKNTPTSKNAVKPAKASSSSRRAKARRPEKETRSRRSKSTPEPEESEDEPEKKSGSIDYYAVEKKRSLPISKGALKSYDTSRTARASKRGEAVNSAQRAAIKNRQGWLFDNASDSDEDETAKKAASAADVGDKNKRLELEISSAQVKKEVEEDKKRKREESNEPETISKGRRRLKEEKLIKKEESEGEDEQEETRAKRGKKDRLPTPPKPSPYGPRSSPEPKSPPPPVEYIEPEERKVQKIKIKLLPPQSDTPGRSVFKNDKSKDILYYNKFPKHKPLSEIGELKEIELVEGVMINTSGGWNVFVRDISGTCCFLSAEEAHERCGWALTQFLLARAKFH